MSEFGLLISKAGFEPNNSDRRNIIFDSRLNVPKIVAMGAISLSHTLGETNHTIYTHGLGYQPTYRLYFEYSAGSGQMYGDNGFDNSNGSSWAAKISSTALEIDTSVFLPTGTYRVFYVIFADPAKSTVVKVTPSGTVGLAITKAGFDPSTDDLKNFVFHSEYQTPNIITVVTLTTTTSNQTTSVAHNMSIRPMWAGVIDDNGTWYDLPYIIPSNSNYEVWVTSTDVHVRTLTIAANATRNYKVMLFNKAI